MALGGHNHSPGGRAGWGHDSLSCCFFYFASCLSITIIKTKPFKVAKYKKGWQIFRPKWVKIKTVVIILSLLLMRTKTHITNTHNIQIK